MTGDAAFRFALGGLTEATRAKVSAAYKARGGRMASCNWRALRMALRDVRRVLEGGRDWREAMELTRREDVLELAQG